MTTGGEAFGRPGTEPRWTSSSKEGVGTALADASPVWFTLAYGILNEIYYPRVDQANTRDAQYLVTDGRTFFHEEKRDLDHRLEYADPRSLAFRQTNSDRAGRYRIVKETITDPAAPTVLVHTRFEPLQPEAESYNIFTLVAPHLGNQGMGNSGRVLSVDGRAFLAAERAGTALAVAASLPFRRRSCGFVGASDAWQDIREHLRMRWEFETATDGNIALAGELDTDAAKEWTLAIGFGATIEEAVRAAAGSLERGWDAARSGYVGLWREYCDGLADLGGEGGDGGRTYLTSAMLVRAHEDRRHKGAVCASLSIPWGEILGDQNIGGYHLVWPRDLYHAATAALASGDARLPARVIRYLAAIQFEDGGMPQNCWVDGRPYWSGVQLDEVAFPLILAWHMGRLGLLGDFDPYPLVLKGASFLLRHGPASQQERWEEEAGISPSTLAAEIAALVCAAEMAESRGDERTRRLCLTVADWWAANVETWTYTTRGTLLDGHPEHFVRLEAVDPETLESDWDPNTGFIQINNLSPDHAPLPVYELIDGGFLELVRYGVRGASDECVTKSVKVYDAVLRSETPCGPVWRRYNHDGYGQKANGDAFDGAGVGRGWPLLSGERAHYEVAAGRGVEEYIKAIECFANAGAMLPEQVWDVADIPEKHMFCGRPTGAAMPLVWAHAEYIKLLRSSRDRAVFDSVEPVRRRYAVERSATDVYVWRFTQKLRAAPAVRRLRVEVFGPARLRWSANEWATVSEAELADEGLGVYAWEFPAGTFHPRETLKFTFYWTAAGHWEGRDFLLTIV